MNQAGTYKDWTDFSTNWRIYDGYTTPLLRAFLTKITVSSTGLATPVYNGQAQQLSAADLSYSSTVDLSKVWETAQATQTNAGSYLLADMLYSSQDGYDFTSTDFYKKIRQNSLLLGTILLALPGTVLAAPSLPSTHTPSLPEQPAANLENNQAQPAAPVTSPSGSRTGIRPAISCTARTTAATATACRGPGLTLTCMATACTSADCSRTMTCATTTSATRKPSAMPVPGQA
jgi:hypothetical protein